MAYSKLPIGYQTSETSKENLQRHEISRILVFRDVTRHRCVSVSWRFERTRCCPSRSTHPAKLRHIPGHWNPQGRHCERLRTRAWSPPPSTFYVYVASSTSLDQKEQGYSIQTILINTTSFYYNRNICLYTVPRVTTPKGHHDTWTKKVNVYLPSLRMKVPDHVYVLGHSYTSHTLIKYNRYA
jgi:hypothetical protein